MEEQRGTHRNENGWKKVAKVVWFPAILSRPTTNKNNNDRADFTPDWTRMTRFSGWCCCGRLGRLVGSSKQLVYFQSIDRATLILIRFLPCCSLANDKTTLLCSSIANPMKMMTHLSFLTSYEPETDRLIWFFFSSIWFYFLILLALLSSFSHLLVSVHAWGKRTSLMTNETLKPSLLSVSITASPVCSASMSTRSRDTCVIESLLEHDAASSSAVT